MQTIRSYPMTGSRITCPICYARLQLPDVPPIGKVLKCPKCEEEFRYMPALVAPARGVPNFAPQPFPLAPVPVRSSGARSHLPLVLFACLIIGVLALACTVLVVLATRGQKEDLATDTPRKSSPADSGTSTTTEPEKHITERAKRRRDGTEKPTPSADDDDRLTKGKTAKELVELAQKAQEKKEIDLAIRYYTAALKLEPKQLTYGNRATLYLQKGENDKALEDVEAALKLDRTYAGGWFVRGIIMWQKGDYEKALADLSEAIQLNGNVGVFFATRSQILSELGRNDPAFKDAGVAIQLGPQEDFGYHARGMVYWNVEEFDKALADFERAIRLNPGNGDAHAYVALLLSKKNKGQAGLTAAKKAVELEPKGGLAWASMAAANLVLGDLKQAEEAIAKAIEVAPRMPMGYMIRGKIAARRGQSQAALNDFNQALTILPNYAEALDERAKLFRQLGETGKANADVAKARQLRGG